MNQEKSGFEEVESLLKDIGFKIEQLIERGAQASGEAKVEIEKKIKELKEKKTTLEEEFNKGKAKVEQIYQEKKVEMEPDLTESFLHFKAGFRKLIASLKILFSKSK